MGLLNLVASGCESELEIWGVTTVLPGPPAVPAWVQQHEVRLGDGRRVRLDAAYPDARVAVELDGRSTGMEDPPSRIVCHGRGSMRRSAVGTSDTCVAPSRAA